MDDFDGRRFGYLHDTLFLASVAIYLVNKFVFKPATTGGFCHAYVNDLLCISFNLPPMLWALRLVGLRGHDGKPTPIEILGAVIAFSLVFEVWLPLLPIQSPYVYADPWDVVCYAVNGLASGVWWTAAYRSPPDARSR